MANFYIANSLSIVRALGVLVPVPFFSRSYCRRIYSSSADLLLLGRVVGLPFGFLGAAVAIATGLGLLFVPLLCTLVSSK